jgi:hypothetical protein
MLAIVEKQITFVRSSDIYNYYYLMFQYVSVVRICAVIDLFSSFPLAIMNQC